MQIQRNPLPLPLPLPLPTTLLLQAHESCRAVSALHAVVVVVAGVGVADFVLVVFFARCLAKQVRLPLQVFPKSHHQQQLTSPPLSLTPSVSLCVAVSRCLVVTLYR